MKRQTKHLKIKLESIPEKPSLDSPCEKKVCDDEKLNRYNSFCHKVLKGYMCMNNLKGYCPYEHTFSSTDMINAIMTLRKHICPKDGLKNKCIDIYCPYAHTDIPLKSVCFYCFFGPIEKCIDMYCPYSHIKGKQNRQHINRYKKIWDNKFGEVYVLPNFQLKIGGDVKCNRTECGNNVMLGFPWKL